jgi:hypothetical protein
LNIEKIRLETAQTFGAEKLVSAMAWWNRRFCMHSQVLFSRTGTVHGPNNGIDEDVVVRSRINTEFITAVIENEALLQTLPLIGFFTDISIEVRP